MKIDREWLFRELEPPPGGPAKLRARLAGSASRTRLDGWRLAPLVVALTVIGALLLRSERPPDATAIPAAAMPPDLNNLVAAASIDRLLGRESEPFELTIRRGGLPVEVVEIRSGNPNVRLYRFVTEDAPAP